MRYTYKNPENCPVTKIMSVVGGKWKFIILYIIRNSPKRFGQINQFIPSISNKVLTEQLRELEDDKIIQRRVLTDRIPVNVEYSLSAKGKQLVPLIELMGQLGENIS
ncbi:helix-turn-helix domain-containing protein [uncultured Kordia sp.]|uniref:winged helix-turn-helix transcriptional regulator n=1 Tax=uncultured Kordia sp. TaxID=507699 RepID=UPI00260717B2|nr:helix-turn-helix domain-containing protein [uncultured Kordia sp.]